jgi:hypothetical protein
MLSTGGNVCSVRYQVKRYYSVTSDEAVPFLVRHRTSCVHDLSRIFTYRFCLTSTKEAFALHDLPRAQTWFLVCDKVKSKVTTRSTKQSTADKIFSNKIGSVNNHDKLVEGLVFAIDEHQRFVVRIELSVSVRRTLRYVYGYLLIIIE